MATKKQKFEKSRIVTGTVESFISDGMSEITSVGEELREAYDNAPDNLKNSDVNCRRDEAAGSIENFSEPSVDSSILGELECTCTQDNGKVYRGRQTQSRSCRLSNGATMLRAAAEVVQGWLEENDELPEADENDIESLRARADALEKLEEKGWDAEDYNAARTEAEELASSLEEIADEAENLDIPGMFG